MKQSIWVSDITRLTYIIKETSQSTISQWYYDYKGHKTKIYIIDPLLQYIKNYCLKYIEKNKLFYDNFDKIADQCLINYEKNKIILGVIITEIDNENLANDIIRYIAPYFSN